MLLFPPFQSQPEWQKWRIIYAKIASRAGPGRQATAFHFFSQMAMQITRDISSRAAILRLAPKMGATTKRKCNKPAAAGSELPPASDLL